MSRACDSCVLWQTKECKNGFTFDCKSDKYERRAFCNECLNYVDVDHSHLDRWGLSVLKRWLSDKSCSKGGYKNQINCTAFKPNEIYYKTLKGEIE
jgi:hypothetical protein